VDPDLDESVAAVRRIVSGYIGAMSSASALDAIAREQHGAGGKVASPLARPLSWRAPSLSAERSAEAARCQPGHPPKIRCQMALAREPGGMGDLGDRAVAVAQEFQRTLDPPFHDKLLWWLPTEILNYGEPR
jgi:hypothetical protein